MSRLFYFIFFSALLLTIYSCTDPSSFGSGLLDDSKINLNFESDFEIEAKTIAGKPQISLIKDLSSLSSYMIGEYNDPIFGVSKSELFTKITYNPTEAIPDFSTAIIDSVVMVMSYDSSSTYPVKTVLHPIEIFEVTTLARLTDTVYTNASTGTLGVKIGNINLTPNTKDSITIKNYLNDTIFSKIIPQIRIPLTASWFADKLKVPSEVSSVTLLQEKIKGLVIKSNAKSSILGLNFGAAADGVNGGINGIYVYYRNSAGTKSIYRFLFSIFKYSSASVAPSAIVTAAIDNTVVGSQNVFVQGIDGVSVEIDIKDLSSKLKDKIINSATLTVIPLALEGDDLKVNVHPFLLALGYDVGNNTTLISDIEDLISVQVPVDLGYGGILTKSEGTAIGKYDMTVTKAIKNLLANKIPGGKLKLFVYNSTQRPQRVVLAGPKHSSFPMKLKVTYTEKN